jgi:dihydrofolate reductase
MGKIILLMHTSLDGFAAGPNGEMDWIDVNEQLFDTVGQLTAEADTALYGRVTYQMMESYWPTAGEQPYATKHDIEHAEWYNRVKKVVLSNSMKEEKPGNTMVISSDQLPGAIKQLKQSAEKNILFIGSPTAVHSLLAHNLVDEFWLFVNPVLLGEGIPVFKNVQAQAKLTLVSSKAFPSGVICLQYERK